MGWGAAGASRGHGACDGSLARLILDTTVLVDTERGGNSLGGAIDDGDNVAVAAITVAELRVGVQLARGRRRDKRERFVAAVLDAVSIEPHDLDVGAGHARLTAPVPSAEHAWWRSRPQHSRDGTSPGAAGRELRPSRLRRAPWRLDQYPGPVLTCLRSETSATPFFSSVSQDATMSSASR